MSRTAPEKEAKKHETIRFGGSVFNLKTMHLQTLDGETVELRSQSAEVLAYLAAHSGQVVPKQELFENIWGDTFVTDDSLVQCIADIRRALCDQDHKIVQTLPKKGYKLTSEFHSGNGSSPPPKKTVGPLLRGVVPVMVVVIAALAWIYWGGIGNERSSLGSMPRIAILPFDDFSAGEDKAYLSDAIAEGIITELARNRALVVIARNSSFRYRNTDTDIRQIGKELGVHYVLEGSQQKSGNKLKVTAQLIDATSGKHIWAHTYEQSIGDLFVVQDQIIRTAADRIGVRINRPVPGTDPDRIDALHYSLLALAAIFDDMSEENNAVMLEMNQKAIEVDPSSHFGYRGLAFAYRHAATFGYHDLSPEKAIEMGLENGLKALEIAPDDPDVHYALARLYAEAGDTETSMARFTTAIELNPSASNYLVASTTPMLNLGQTDEAIERLKQAMGIDPFHPDWYHWQMGWALWEKDQCDDALAAMMRMKKIPKGAHRMLAGIYACIGDVEEAQKAYQVFYTDSTEPTISEQRAAWEKNWTAPGSLDRFLEHMKIAGMKE